MGSERRAVTIVTLVLLNLSLFASFLAPNSVSACGIFDILSCFKGADVLKAENDLKSNSSAIALQAVNSPNQQKQGQKEIAIVESTSLLSEPEAPGGAPGTGTNGSTTGSFSSSDQISLYVVHPGDTLPAIAKMFGVTTNTIVWANDLKGSKISVGQTLVIMPISGVQHIVKSGDTLLSIAKQHKGDLDEILQYNNLAKDSKLAVGDVIIVPDGEITPTYSPSKSSSISVGVGIKGSSYPVYDGYYMRPIIGGIRTQGVHGHNGVDLASSYGSNILASADGTVIIAKSSGWNGGYGSYIVLSHSNGTQTLYGHLSQVNVSVGDSVSQGEVIGKMGSTGNSTGVHVHFEIRGARNPF